MSTFNNNYGDCEYSPIAEINCNINIYIYIYIYYLNSYNIIEYLFVLTEWFKIN